LPVLCATTPDAPAPASRADGEQGSAQLERPAALQVLRLQPDPGTGSAVQLVTAHHGRPHDPPGQQALRGQHVAAAACLEGGASSLVSSPYVVADI
jgi:hypothetical protein